MEAPKVIKGVWVTGFEETSFLPNAKALPDRNDRRRYRMMLDIDPERVSKLLGRQLVDRDYHAVRLTFVGRQSEYPLAIDCYGGRDYLIVADWVIRAQYLGKIGNPDLPPPPLKQPPYKSFKPSGEGGRIAQMEKEALARCAGD